MALLSCIGYLRKGFDWFLKQFIHISKQFGLKSEPDTTYGEPGIIEL